MSLAENPRAVIGNNRPPVDDENDSPPTLEEAKTVAEAISYLQFRVPDLEDLCVKRKGGRILGWRLLLAWSLKGSVRLCAVHQLLALNRKTAGENQQRPERWMEVDDEADDLFAKVREAIYWNSQVNPARTTELLKIWVKRDPELRILEEQQRAHMRAAAVAETEAQRLKESERIKQIEDLARKLKGVKGKARVIASHKGPKVLAGEMTKQGLAVLERMVKKEAKSARETASTYNPEGLKECVKLGLARNAEPHLSKTLDPKVTHTGLGAEVYAWAIDLGRLEKPRKKKKPDA